MSTQLDEKLSALLDGALTQGEAAALRAEIARSPALAERFAALAAVDEDLRALPSRPVPAGLRARIALALSEPSPARRSAPSRRRRWLGAAALAATAAAVLALVLLPGGDTEPEPAPIARQAPPTRVEVAERAPAPTLAPPVVPPRPVPSPVLEAPAVDDIALGEDLPVIEVLDLLAELDELEGNGHG